MVDNYCSILFDEFPAVLTQLGLDRWPSEEVAIAFLHDLVGNGGPTPEQYELLTSCFFRLWKEKVPFHIVRDAVKVTISTTNCIQGFGFLKPHGYAGDFEMIDRIYTHWKSSDPALRRWDEYFHSQPAPRAVRNRKAYFHERLRHAKLRLGDDAEIRVLNLGSGPARDVFEYLRGSSRHVMFDCVDLDYKAIHFAKALCEGYEGNISFLQQNILRLQLERHYDLLWSAGLFDYFTDRVFVTILSRLKRYIKPGGEIVIGNFSKGNPSRYWMEAVGDWKLSHRNEDQLIALAGQAGIESHRVKVGVEPEKVNLFLHITG